MLSSCFCRYTEDRQVSEEDDDYGSCCGSDEPACKRPKRDTTNSDVGSRNKLPDHFCDVKLSPEDNDNWQCLFSPFDEPANIGCMIVELCAGEMLYLPASWFHEVKRIPCVVHCKNKSETGFSTSRVKNFFVPEIGHTCEII